MQLQRKKIISTLFKPYPTYPIINQKTIVSRTFTNLILKKQFFNQEL